MSYCRFRNTVDDLRDCEEHITDEELSLDEARARQALIKLCRDIIVEWDSSGMDA